MPLDPSYVGRSYPYPEPYTVGVEKIREFAAAIGDDNPMCHDRAVARAAGHRDLIAPPTFAIAVVAGAQEAVVFDPALGLDFSRVVHGDQRFEHHRPITAGDVLSVTVHVDAIRSLGSNDMLTLRCEVTGADGDPVTTARSTLVARGTAA